jgi:hypothetical protein
VTASWPRLFECNDSEWAPVALRETLVESLSRTLVWGRVLSGLVEPFERFLDAAGTREVLDLCSGAGGPAANLIGEIERSGGAVPRFLLTDLAPRLAAWKLLARRPPGAIDWVARPVDALAVPERIARGRARVIINALHHFPPEAAGRLLCSAMNGAPGIFVAECLVRDPAQLIAMAPAGLPALLLNPILSPTRRLAKAALTWLTPIALAAAAWDVGVSVLRLYGESQLRALVAPLGDGARWTDGTYAYAPFGRGFYFYGVRRGARRRSAPPRDRSSRAARSNTTQAPQRAQSTSLP